MEKTKQLTDYTPELHTMLLAIAMTMQDHAITCIKKRNETELEIEYDDDSDESEHIKIPESELVIFRKSIGTVRNRVAVNDAAKELRWKRIALIERNIQRGNIGLIQDGLGMDVLVDIHHEKRNKTKAELTWEKKGVQET